ncbi:2TM domain-containing protein [Altibacter sp.]|uniref:2TM domain-containing protein n=1 Tax=Altibacter sp. TaxID=2024823 RepID=UPI00258FEB45|nr:2TM domain-containing protein [Altibacter sp.]MCW9036841.1 2TM domain-containing protein [Altibacter sp.]
MFSKTNKKERIDSEQREQYEYARARIKQKKRLMQHFIVFLVGSVFLIILNPVLGIGKDFFINNWFVWAILIWAFLFLIHVFNVFIMNSFMGKEWEDRELEKLKAKQAARISELQQKVDNELQLPELKKNKPSNPLPPDVQ